MNIEKIKLSDLEEELRIAEEDLEKEDYYTLHSNNSVILKAARNFRSFLRLVSSEGKVERMKIYHKSYNSTNDLVKARTEGIIIDDKTSWNYEYTVTDSFGKYDQFYRLIEE